jgi:hypothetical protein
VVAHSSAPIEDYGLLGDTRTAALVTSTGAIDWLCIPRFDGEPVFGRIIGGLSAGTYRVGPAHPSRLVVRRYHRHTATLVTTWVTETGRLTLTEAMVAEVSGTLLPATLLVRRLTAEGAAVDTVVEFDPRLGEGHRKPRIQRRGGDLVCEWGTLALSLGCYPDLAIAPPRSCHLSHGRPGWACHPCIGGGSPRAPRACRPGHSWELVAGDEDRWVAWAAGIDEAFRRARRRSGAC